ncbi:MAG: class II aldolase/adducin family protein [Anaerolineales bacterium]|jgi:L-ribulose-5-phosphate 4-epimerase
MSAIEKAKENVLWGCKTMCSRGYVLATGGNISSLVEGEEKYVITPSSCPYDTLTKKDLPIIDMEGEIIEGDLKPSVESSMHRLIYLNRPNVKSVIHMHSKFATAAASLEGVTEIPAFSFEILGYFGGDSIPLVPFAAPGTMDLAEAVTESMGSKMGAIMANHGAIGVGATMEEAMTKCDIIERACEEYLVIRAVGKVRPVPADFIEEFKSYVAKRK